MYSKLFEGKFWKLRLWIIRCCYVGNITPVSWSWFATRNLDANRGSKIPAQHISLWTSLSVTDLANKTDRSAKRFNLATLRLDFYLLTALDGIFLLQPPLENVVQILQLLRTEPQLGCWQDHLFDFSPLVCALFGLVSAFFEHATTNSEYWFTCESADSLYRHLTANNSIGRFVLPDYNSVIIIAPTSLPITSLLLRTEVPFVMACTLYARFVELCVESCVKFEDLANDQLSSWALLNCLSNANKLIILTFFNLVLLTTARN